MPVVMTALKYIQTSAHENLINLTGKTTLENVLNIISSSSLVIGNETGLVHIASLWSVPTVMFYGGGHFGRLLPKKAILASCLPMPCYYCEWHCIHPDSRKMSTYPCIEEIDENELEITLHNLIKNKVLQ